MSDADKDGRACFLLAHFARALAHQVRGPLGVISNDLFYFQSLLPDEDFARPLAKCKEIDQILRQAASFETKLPEVMAVSPALLLEEIFTAGWRMSHGDVEADGCLIAAQELRLKRTLLWLKELLGKGAAGREQNAGQIELQKIGRQLVCKFVRPHLMTSSLERSFHGKSLVEFFNCVLGLDSLLPSLVEAELMALGAEIDIRAAEGIEVDVSFSLI